MALWSRPEPPGTAPVAPGEFEGRTVEEALEKARRALGPSAELRCWRTRRGGVAGFFATEVFVASVNPPEGSLAAPPKGLFRRNAQSKAGSRRGSASVGTTDPAGSTRLASVKPISPGVKKDETPDRAVEPPVDPPVDPPVVTYERPARGKKADDEEIAGSLAALAEGTTDQLSLNFDVIPAQTFDEVLAEAEAAVTGATSWSDRSGPSVQSPVSRSEDGQQTEDRASDREAGNDGGGDGNANGADVTVAPMDPGATPARDKDVAARYQAVQDARPDGGQPVRAEPDGGQPVRAEPDGADEPASEDGRVRARSKGSTGSRSAKARASAPAESPAKANGPPPQLIPDLFSRLRDLGVPDAHLPDNHRPTLDAVARTLNGLPKAPPLPTAPGSVIALVGTGTALARTIRLLAGEAPFLHGVRPDPSKAAWAPEGRTENGAYLDDVLQQGDPLEVAGRVARRRLDGRPSLVTAEIAPGLPPRAQDLGAIVSVQPDYVLGALVASVKRADVVRWRDELGVLDALALWGLDNTVSPADLLGVVPIAFVDGAPGTPLTWTLTLLNRAAEGVG